MVLSQCAVLTSLKCPQAQHQLIQIGTSGAEPDRGLPLERLQVVRIWVIPFKASRAPTVKHVKHWLGRLNEFPSKLQAVYPHPDGINSPVRPRSKIDSYG